MSSTQYAVRRRGKQVVTRRLSGPSISTPSVQYSTTYKVAAPVRSADLNAQNVIQRPLVYPSASIAQRAAAILVNFEVLEPLRASLNHGNWWGAEQLVDLDNL